MSITHTIALFSPDARLAEQVTQLFSRHSYRLFKVDSAAQLLSGAVASLHELDVIVIPIRLMDGSSGLTACLQLKQGDHPVNIPILGLAFSREHNLVQNFYEMGADVVFSDLSDPELLHFQLTSLARLRNQLGVPSSLPQRDPSPIGIDALSSAFHASRDGVLLFDREFRLTFGNSNARSLLGIPSPAEDRHIQTIETLLQPSLKKHQAKSESIQASSRKLYEEASEVEVTMTPFNGPNFTALVRIVSLYEEQAGGMETSGYAASFYHLGEILQLQNLLDQADRTRALCFISAACALQYLEPTQSGIVVSPLMRMQESFETVNRECALTPALTSLLEYLDLLISPDVSVKVKMKEDLVLLMKRSDLFLLLGHLIMHSVSFAGSNGEVLVEVSDYQPGAGVIITVSARAREVISVLEGSRLSQLLSRHISTSVKFQDTSEKIRAGLGVATDIAKNYRTEIQFQSPNAHETRLRVSLPARYSREQ